MRAWEEATAAALTALDRYRKPAYLVELEEGESPRTANKVLGSAYLRAGEAWPLCPYCNNKMTLLLQVAIADIADVAPGLDRRGLLQFFCCLNNCELPGSGGPECNSTAGWDVIKDDNNVVRVVIPTSEGSNDVPPDHQKTQNYYINLHSGRRGGGSTTARRITRLTLIEDRPYASESRLLLQGSVMTDLRASAPSSNAEWEFLSKHGAARRMKVGGHPVWLQGPEWPRCECGSTMRLLICFSTYEHLRIWHDAYLNVFYCERHPDSFATVIQSG